MSNPEVVIFHNALEVEGDGFAMLAPWGEFGGIANTAAHGDVRRTRAVQTWDRGSADEILNGFEGLSDAGRFRVGVPIYDGHPDSPVIGHRYPNKAPIGSIAELQIRERGLFGKPVFTPAAAPLLSGSTRVGFSTRVAAVPVSDAPDGVKRFRPVHLLSVGITSKPNLPVEMLNECEQAGTSTMNKEHIIAWLKGQGVEIANDAGDDAIKAGLDTLGARLKGLPALEQERDTLKKTTTELANERDALKQSTVELTNERDAARTQLATATKERDQVKTEFANERAGRIGNLLDLGVRGGHIAEADREKWKGRLAGATEFANETEELFKQKVLKTLTAVPPARKASEINNEADDKSPKGLSRVSAAIEKSIGAK